MTTQFKSIRDFGYQQAVHDDVGLDFARWALANLPGFPEIDDENKRMLFGGYLTRKQEITAPAYYKRVDVDKYEPASGPGEGVVVIDIDYAFSFSQQQFGSLRTKQAGLHGIIKPMRDAGSAYCSGRFSSLKRKVSEVNPKKRERGETLSFHDWLADFAESIVPKAKAAANRGDTTAPSPEKAKAIAAAMLKASK